MLYIKRLIQELQNGSWRLLMIEKAVTSEDDAEYYLAMSYLSNNESEKAIPYFEKIKADPENRHYEDVSELFLMNVRNSVVKK